MPIVTNTVKYPNGTVAAGRVTVDLVGDNGRPVTDGVFVTASDYSIEATYGADLVAGVWSATLVANSLINPSGTRWRVQESVDGRVTTYYLNVPNGAGPYYVEDILDEAPASVASSALTAHLDDTTAHEAADVTFTPAGTIAATDVQAAIEEVASEAAQLGPASVLELDGQTSPMAVWHNYFWPAPVNLGVFLWEAWLAPFVTVTPPRYWISDGYGGNHAILAGFTSGDSGRSTPTGNVYTGVGSTSFTGFDGIADGEWCHYAVSWDGTNIRVFLNGILCGKAAFAGPRQADATTGAGLWIGGSTHNSFYGRIAMVRGYEGVNPGFGFDDAPFAPERPFTLSSAGSPQFMANYLGSGGLQVPDLSDGFNGRLHHGVAIGSNAGSNPSYQAISTLPGPTYVNDLGNPFALGTTIPAPDEDIDTPPSTPVGARIFDSFSRKNQTLAFMAEPSLGSTEAGSLGPLAWSVDGAAGTYFGIMRGRAVKVSGSTFAIATVDNGQADMDVRADRTAAPYTAVGGEPPPLVARAVDRSNCWWVANTGGAGSASVSLIKRVAGVDTVVVSATDTSSWTTCRVTFSGNTYTLYVDNGAGGWTTLGTGTDAALNTATRAGILGGSGSGATRADNFTVI